ncbi:hypothetical protein PLESTB_001648500 [Pleodorina starrii]|uniref:Reverse transcriptase domain-containing protein n=1 Tax=Pleodorina starrii TaxID=330485 RepID=A0A9W6BYH8_9CHLO|nr:hypothetical protein PLESTB_001648500 [Pleodorina starrii]
MSNNDPANSIRSLVRPAQRSLFTSRAAAPSRSSLANSVARQSAGGLSLAQRATNTSHKRPAEGVAREDATKRQQAPSSVPPPVEPQPITNAGHIRAEAGQQDPEGETAGAPAKGASASAEAVGSQPGASQILPRRQAENDRKPALSGVVADLPEDSWEFEGGGADAKVKPAKPVPQMRHRLRNNLWFWRSFCRSSLVLSWIAVGYCLMWNADCPKAGPDPVRLPNHGSALQNQGFVKDAVAELVATGAALALPDGSVPHCVMPLGVVPKAGTDKFRLIYDARYLNKLVVTPSFKYETLAGLGTVLQPGDYLFTVDLKSGYHHLDIHPDFWRYLGFMWEGKYYVFTQLPFGLAPACWAFTKLTRELQTLWRSEGHRTSGYIDDSIHAHQDPAVLEAWKVKVLGDLERAGFIVSEKKCDLVLSQQKKYLGALVDTSKGCLLVPAEKQMALLQNIQLALDQQPDGCKVRQVASIVGHLMSMSYSFGELSTLMTRRLTAWQGNVLRAGFTLEDRIPLDSASIEELNFWRTAVQRYDGRKPLWPPSNLHTIKIFSDAAGRSRYSFGGWGGWAKIEGQLVKAAGRWDFDTAPRSSTYLEMRGVWKVLRSLNTRGQLTEQRVMVNTDNYGTFCILTKAGSVVPDIHDVCMSLFWYVIEHKITLVANWIPREQNVLADALSKADISSDWMLHPEVFGYVEWLWGPFEVDLFASETNHLVPTYFSHYYTPTCAGVNAFSRVWPRTSWCNPPFGLIGRVLEHAARCRTRMALIVPFWPGAAWWHKLVENACVFQSFVWDCVVLPARKDLFLSGAYGNTLSRERPNWGTLALLVDFASECDRAILIPDL